MNTEQITSNLLFSFNSVIPVFLIILIGFFLRRSILTPQFSQSSNKLVFNVALPAMIFNSIYTADLGAFFDINIIIFCTLGTIILFMATSFTAFFFLPEKKSLGSFVQGSFRSNFVIIGIPLIHNLAVSLGPDAISKSSIIVSVIMPLYNILSVLILSFSSTSKTDISLLKITKDIIRNPLIIAVLVALPFSLFNITMPRFFSKSVDYLAAIAVPLALIDIGYNMNFKCFVNTLRPALVAASIKIALSPLIFTYSAWLLNFRGSDLGVIYILFASPTAIASYIMAKGTKNDADLAANIVLITTIGSIFTIFTGVFILRTLGLFN